MATGMRSDETFPTLKDLYEKSIYPEVWTRPPFYAAGIYQPPRLETPAVFHIGDNLQKWKRKMFCYLACIPEVDHTIFIMDRLSDDIQDILEAEGWNDKSPADDVWRALESFALEPTNKSVYEHTLWHRYQKPDELASTVAMSDLSTVSDRPSEQDQEAASSEPEEPPFEDETAAILEDDIAEEETESGEKLFRDDLETDYRPIPGIDVYEAESLADADEDFNERNPTALAEAEPEMRQRDREQMLTTGGPRRGLIADLCGPDEEDLIPTHRKCLTERAAAGMVSKSEEPQAVSESIENSKDTEGMSVIEWIQQPASLEENGNRFRTSRIFLNEPDWNIYSKRITQMAGEKKQSLYVDYRHLTAAEQALAYFLPEAPQYVLEMFDEATQEVTLSTFSRHDRISNRVHVRISGLPLIEDLRLLCQLHPHQHVRTSDVSNSSPIILKPNAKTVTTQILGRRRWRRKPPRRPEKVQSQWKAKWVLRTTPIP